MDVLARYDPLVDDPAAFRAACERPLPAVVRANTIVATAERVRRAFDERGVAYDPVGWHDGLFRLDRSDPGNTWPYVHGWVHGQEEVSAIPPVVLDPEPGERVLDACAAPGSKTTQLAARMDDEGTLVANDDDLGRLAALRSNAQRCGVTNVAVTNRDGRTLSTADGRSNNRASDENRTTGGNRAAGRDQAPDRPDAVQFPFPFDAFDRTLVDVPCSCEGTVRKNPGVLEDWSIDHVRGIAGLQTGILERSIELTRPGGTVVYSTCTFAPEENEAVLDRAIRETDCRPVDYDLPLDHRPGVTEWEDERFDDSVRNAKRIYPHHNDTGGFFCAKLEVTG